MAVKKAEKKEELRMDADVVTEVDTTVAEDTENTEEVAVSEEPSLVDKVTVDETPIDTREQAETKPCKVKLREDHKCWLNNECYELKKGQTYNVPKTLKFRLNKAGLLLPLN